MLYSESVEEKLKICNLRLELKLTRCDELVEQYKRRPGSNLDCIPNTCTQRSLKSKKKGRPKKNRVKENDQLPKRRKNSPKLCWGCLEEGDLKNMHVPRYGDGCTEIYADMANYCFSTKMKKDLRINYICDNCIQKLRDTIRFKKQILIAQNYLNQVTGGPSLILNEYTGQSETYNSSPNMKNFNGNSSTLKAMTASPAPVALPLQSVQMVDNSSGFAFTTFPTAFNPANSVSPGQSMPVTMIPIMNSNEVTSTPMYLVNKSGEKQPLLLFPVPPPSSVLESKNDLVTPKHSLKTNINFLPSLNQKVLNYLPCDKKSPGKKVIIIKRPLVQTPSSVLSKMAKTIEKCPSSGVSLPEVYIEEIQESSDDDVQVIEDNGDVDDNKTRQMMPLDATPESRLLSRLLVPVDLEQNNAYQYYNENVDCYVPGEDTEETEYVTSDDFAISKTTQGLFDKIDVTDSCRCPLCSLEFLSIADRRSHLQERHHESCNVNMCEECGFKTSNSSYLNRHIREKHLKVHTGGRFK